MKFADQRRFAERVKPRPFVVRGDRTPVAIEADDIAPPLAGLDRLPGLPGEPAAQVEMARIVPAQGLGDRAEIGFGKPPTVGSQIVDDCRIAEGRRRQREPEPAQRIPGGERYAPGLPETFGLAIGLDEVSHKSGLGRAFHAGGQGMDGKRIILLRVCGGPPPPRQLIIDKIADQVGIVPKPRRGILRHFVGGGSEAAAERVRHRSPPVLAGADLGILAFEIEGYRIGQLVHEPQIGVTPIADRVEAPSLEPGHSLLAPARPPVGAEFALQICGIKIEGASVIEGAAALRAETAPVVALAPVGGELAVQGWQVTEHELAVLDIGRPLRLDDIHADREEGVVVGGDEPPSVGAPFGAEEAGGAEAAAGVEAAEAVALRCIGAPDGKFVSLLDTLGAEHLDRAYLSGPVSWTILTEPVDDPGIRVFVRLTRRLGAQRPYNHVCRGRGARYSEPDGGNIRGVDRAFGRGHWYRAGRDRGRTRDHAHRA